MRILLLAVLVMSARAQLGGSHGVAPDAESHSPLQDPEPSVGQGVGSTSFCSEQCPRIFAPVCGSDGFSYNNPCILQIADCKSKEAGGRSISVVHEGSCEAAGQNTQVLSQQTPAPTSDPPVEPPVPASTCSERCTRIFAPVCGSDGLSYNNPCILRIADCKNKEAGGTGVNVVHEGSCVTQDTQEPGGTGGGDAVNVGDPTFPPPSPCARACTRNYLPVCGSDGKDYSNRCLLDIASCESNLAGGNNISVVSDGVCGAVDPTTAAPASPCPQECTKIYLPLCGSDGKSYNNRCLLDLASCESLQAGGNEISVVSEGLCEPATDSQDSQHEEEYSPCRRCKDIYRPVCGNDGHTYDNECILDNINCRSWRLGKPGIYIVKNGLCGDYRPTPPAPLQPAASGISPLLTSLGVSSRTSSCPDHCTEEYSPVCGTDKLTYDNECFLLSASCRRRSLGGHDITKAFDGPCVAALPRGPVCDTGCDKSMAPVCGSDGITYGNRCLLSLADCLNPFASITYVNDGSCDSSVEDDSNSEDVELDEYGVYLPPV